MKKHPDLRRRRQRRPAFTLIELLVVIAILAILAAILFPVFARARENARRSSCQSNLKQVGLGCHQYAQDYDEKLPLPAWANLNSNGYMTYDGTYGANYGTVATASALADYDWDKQQRVSWVDEIMPYVKSQQIFYCPSDTLSTKRPKTAPMGTVSYGYNVYMSGFVYTAGSPDLGADNAHDCGASITTCKLPGQALAAISSTSWKVLMGDRLASVRYGLAVLGPQQAGYGGQTGSIAGPAVELDSGSSYGQFVKSDTAWAGAAEMNGRHFGGANVAFADGHVKWIKAGEPGFAFIQTGTMLDSFQSRQAVRYWAPISDGGL